MRLFESQGLFIVSVSLLTLNLINPQAHAGGFAVRNQSSEFQGSSFAGNAAAGGGISGIFWNPAVAAFAPAGLTVEIHGAVAFPDMSILAQSGTLVPPLGTESGRIDETTFIPAGYITYKINKDLEHFPI